MTSHTSRFVQRFEQLLKMFEPASIRATTVVAGAAIVAALEYATHLFVARSGAPLAFNAVIDACVIAVFTLLLLGIVLAAARVQKAAIAKEMHTVAELNHHVRNALQVIRESHRLPTDQQTEAVIESVDRIDNTLRALFPQSTPRRLSPVHIRSMRPKRPCSKLRMHTALASPLVFLLTLAPQAQTTMSPATMTTTLAAETGNNTSGSDAFPVSINGNSAPGNVSKVPLRSLLYDHADTKIYAHFVGWFGGRDHIDVGYQSADPLQVQKQVADMVSRGIDGVIVDWYGPNSSNRSASAINTELATQALMHEAENIPGFEFAIMVDKGALRRCRNHRCDATGELIHQMTYVHDTYQSSPSYMRVNGRPVVLFFGIDQYDIEWTRVARQVPGDPILVFQDTRGFANPLSNAGYAWIHLNREKKRDWMRNYLRYFYRSGKKDSQNPQNSAVYGAVYKGFDDSMASWSENRIMSQDCGRTWLRTWAEIAEHHSATEPLQAVQLVTWNDYEEGTEIETGIDNCVALKAWRAGDSVRWHVGWSSAKHADIEKNGPEELEYEAEGETSRLEQSPEAGIDHFTIFASSDRQTLTQVAEVPATERDLNVATLNLPPGTKYVYVKAIGKPGLLNQMSSAIRIVNEP